MASNLNGLMHGLDAEMFLVLLGVVIQGRLPYWLRLCAAISLGETVGEHLRTVWQRITDVSQRLALRGRGVQLGPEPAGVLFLFLNQVKEGSAVDEDVLLSMEALIEALEAVLEMSMEMGSVLQANGVVVLQGEVVPPPSLEMVLAAQRAVVQMLARELIQ